MLRAFEMDPDSARPMTAAELPEAPLLGQPGFDDGPTWVRVGKEGEWAFGIEDRSVKAFPENIVARVSLGTQSVAVSWTTRGNATIMYHRDGLRISTFSTGLLDSRTGPEPDYFDEALAARGFAESGAAKVSDLPLAERMVVLLGILSELFGIRLSQETYNSPLLTAHRSTPYAYQPWKNPGPTGQVTTVRGATARLRPRGTGPRKNAERVASPSATSGRQSHDKALPQPRSDRQDSEEATGPEFESPDWQWWVRGEILCQGLTFVRGISEREMLIGFETDPDAARPMTPTEAWQDPALANADFDNGPYWVRVARVGEWASAIEWSRTMSYLDNIVRRLSAGTESISISATANGTGNLSYFVDDIWTSGFEVGQPYDSRAGSDPNYFHDALAEVGLSGMDDGTMVDLPPLRRQLLGVLEMLTRTKGIRLPEQVYMSPLLTGYRTEPYSYVPQQV
jgi:hypothetical protein